MRFLLLLFVIIPLVEITLLIEIGSQIGVLATIAWLILAAMLGILLIRIQGIATLMRARELVGQGKAPAAALAHGLLLACAGVLLIVPGFASDTLAFLLLIPALRQLIIGFWARKVKTSTSFRGNVYDVRPSADTSSIPQDSIEPSPGRTLEGEFKRED